MFGINNSEEPQEDLSLNIFFKTLTIKFPKLYAEAEKNCYLICVPKSSALRGTPLSKNDFGMLKR